MAIAFKCTECKRRIKLRDDRAGRWIACPGCEARLKVPAPDESEDTTGEAEDEAPAAPAVTAWKGEEGDTGRRARPEARAGEDAEEPDEATPARPRARRMGPWIGGGVLAALVVLAAVLTRLDGQVAYNPAFDRVLPGMKRVQVVELMGRPRATHFDGTTECWWFEFMDPSGKRSPRSTFYVLAFQDGAVVDKRRIIVEDYDRAIANVGG